MIVIGGIIGSGIFINLTSSPSGSFTALVIGAWIAGAVIAPTCALARGARRMFRPRVGSTFIFATRITR